MLGTQVHLKTHFNCVLVPQLKKRNPSTQWLGWRGESLFSSYIPMPSSPPWGVPYAQITKMLTLELPLLGISVKHLVVRCIPCSINKASVTCYKKVGDPRITRPNKLLPGRLGNYALLSNCRWLVSSVSRAFFFYSDKYLGSFEVIYNSLSLSSLQLLFNACPILLIPKILIPDNTLFWRRWIRNTTTTVRERERARECESAWDTVDRPEAHPTCKDSTTEINSDLHRGTRVTAWNHLPRVKWKRVERTFTRHFTLLVTDSELLRDNDQNHIQWLN